MKVILLEDVKKLGKKGQQIEVADGYGRNYLIRNKLAVAATTQSQAILEQQKEAEKQLDAQLRSEAEALKIKIAKLRLTFLVKSGQDGKVFGSISTKQIADELAKSHAITIDKRKFVAHEALNQLGTHRVQVDLYKGILADITIDLKSTT